MVERRVLALATRHPFLTHLHSAFQSQVIRIPGNFTNGSYSLLLCDWTGQRWKGGIWLVSLAVWIFQYGPLRWTAKELTGSVAWGGGGGERKRPPLIYRITWNFRDTLTSPISWFKKIAKLKWREQTRKIRDSHYIYFTVDWSFRHDSLVNYDVIMPFKKSVY